MKSLFILLISVLLHGMAYGQSFDQQNNTVLTRDTLNFNRPVSSVNFPNKKWTLNKYQWLSTSFVGWKGGLATTFSAPIGVQLNRKINNNMFAFAGISVAPTYVSFRQSFLTTDFNKTAGGHTFRKSNSFGFNPRAEVGLSFINDDRTFQISGSMSVQRNANGFFNSFPTSNWNNAGPLFRSY